MSRVWQPGDVAVATVMGNKGVQVMRRHISAEMEDWAFASTDGVRFSCTTDESEVRDPRPLVVIDPEDREQVRSLLAAILDQRDPLHPDASGIAAALREFADPRPPKPAEPTGLGAVVEAAAYTDTIRPFVRTASDESPWFDDSGNGHEWNELDAVRVLSEGVTA